MQKPAGILSQSSKDSEEYDITTYLQNKLKHKLHLLTRLDRPVGGVMLFSKNKKFTKHYLQQQKEEQVIKHYMALVEKQLNVDKLSLKHWGVHDKSKHKCFISSPKNNKAYEMDCVIDTVLLLDNYSLIDITLHQGRFHQIRSQLSAHGHPIKGDVKYGARRKNKGRHILLHSKSIEFKDIDGDQVKIESELPENDDLWILIKNKLNSSDG